jgi:protein TonB
MKVEVPALPAAAAAIDSTVPTPTAGAEHSGSGAIAPARRERPRPAVNPIADLSVKAPVTGAPQPAERANPGGDVSAAAVAEVKPPAGETAANVTVEPPARPPEPAAAPPAVPNEAPPASTFAQLDLNRKTSLQDLAAVRKPAIPAPPPLRRATPPEVISKVLPGYPELARRTRTWGTVVLEVQIDEQGRPVKAVAESGPAILHQEAIKAVMQWRFRPATLDGVNVSGTTRVSIVFTNQDQNGGQR